MSEGEDAVPSNTKPNNISVKKMDSNLHVIYEIYINELEERTSLHAKIR